MKYTILLLLFILFSLAPYVTTAQTDSVKNVSADTSLVVADTVAVVKNVDTAVVAVPMNCYKQWLDYFTSLGTKPLSDGMHEVVIAFKSKESCHCYMGKVEVA